MSDDVTRPADSLARLEQKIDRLTAQVESVQQVYASAGELYRDMAPIGASMMEVASDHIARLEEQGLFTLVSALSEVATKRSGSAQPAPSMFALLRASAKDEDVRRGLAVAIDVLRTLGENKHRAVPGDPHKAKVQALTAMLAPKATRNTSGYTRVSHETPAPKASRREPAPVAASTEAAEHPDDSTAHDANDSGAHGGWSVEVDDDGFLRNPEVWHLAFAEDMAAQANIALTDQHWQVLNFMRKEFGDTGSAPNIRRITVGSGVDTRELFRLFPKAPAKTAARIAGVPKPVGCV